MKNAGASAATGTDTVELVRPLFVVWICAFPPGVMSVGTRNVTCVLPTVKSVAASPFTVTPTPFTWVGEVAVAVPEVADIPAPEMATHVFGAIGPATQLASLRIPVVRKDGDA